MLPSVFRPLLKKWKLVFHVSVRGNKQFFNISHLGFFEEVLVQAQYMAAMQQQSCLYNKLTE